MPDTAIAEVEPGDPRALMARALQVAILRPGGPLPTDDVPGPDWITLAATDVGGAVLGAVTLSPQAWKRSDLAALAAPAWRLRSLAVAAERRGTGIGSALVLSAVDRAAAAGARALWAEARIAAVPLYEHLGWRIAGAEWDKPGVGPHRFIWTELPDRE